MQTCCVCLDEKVLIPLETCSHGICSKCIVRVFRADPRCPLCRDDGGGRSTDYRDDDSSSESSRGDLFDEAPQDEPVEELSRQYLNQTLVGHRESVMAVSVFPDGTKVVSGSSDRTIKIWDAHTGAELRTLSWHSNSVRAVAVFADGQRVVSGSDDNTVKIWDAESGTCLNTLSGHSGWVNAVAVFADNRRIVSGNDDGTVKIWDANIHEKTRIYSKFQIFTVLSQLPDTTFVQSGKTATVCTQLRCPFRVSKFAPVFASQTFTKLSSLADTTLFPSGNTATVFHTISMP